MVGWGAMALLQCAAHNFAGMLVIRILLGAFEAGFFAGVVFYLTLFYTRGELGFRDATWRAPNGAYPNPLPGVAVRAQSHHADGHGPNDR